MDGCHWTLDGPVLFLPLQHLITLTPITTPCFSSQRGALEVAEIENSNSGYMPSRWFTTVLLPAPDGAEKMITLLLINNVFNIRQK